MLLSGHGAPWELLAIPESDLSEEVLRHTQRAMSTDRTAPAKPHSRGSWEVPHRRPCSMVWTPIRSPRGSRGHGFASAGQALIVAGRTCSGNVFG
eukprot:gene24617-biopygen13462